MLSGESKETKNITGGEAYKLAENLHSPKISMPLNSSSGESQQMTENSSVSLSSQNQNDSKS